MEADLKTFHRHGVYGMAISTLLTAQNTMGVKKVRYLEPDFLEEQFDLLMEDLVPTVIKVGAIGSRQVLLTLYRLLSQPGLKETKIVLDTVLSSSSGHSLFDMRGLADFIDRLMPLAYLVTPNIPEFRLISGKHADDGSWAAALQDFGGGSSYSILLKGGHMEGDPVDYLFHGQKVTTFPSRRIRTRNTHGTGCAMASALSANLALGRDLVDSVRKAQDFVHKAIAENPGLGKGRGPLNLWADVDWQDGRPKQ